MAHDNHHHNHNTVSRLPTLSEVVSSKTRSPVDLFGFYIYMRDEQRSVDCTVILFRANVNHRPRFMARYKTTYLPLSSLRP